MLQSYASMEKSLRKLNPNAAEMAHYKIHEVALALRDMDFIDNNVLILINRLYTIRNFVAHTERGVTSAEATDFVSMCGTVEAIIAAARARTAGSP